MLLTLPSRPPMLETQASARTASSTPPDPSPEARSGLGAWRRADLPEPPRPRGLQWLGVVGPGIIVLGAAIGSGEFLLGPATFVRFGLTLLWVTTLASILQTVFNTELMRYTMATGEPAVTGFMRTRPHATFWAWFYAALYFLQVGWPGWAGAASGAIFFLFTKRLATPDDASIVYWIGIGTFLACVGVLLVGRRIERTLEVLNWILVVAILGSFAVLVAIFVAPETIVAAIAGHLGFDPASGRFNLLPEGVDFFLLAAVAAYSGAGGVINITLSNWARDKGYGMGGMTGYIPAAVGGKKVNLAHTGVTFTPDEKNLARWRGWWRIVRVDQWGIFCTGAILGMLFPALLYITFLEGGQDIRGLGIAATLANGMEARIPLMGGVIAFMGAWILFKTQLDILEALVRSATDILWTGSKRIREWRSGDVRRVYYFMLGLVVVWGAFALGAAQPILLLQLSANVGAVVFVIAGTHLLYINTRLLPPELRPGLAPRAGLVILVLFYGFFAFLSIRTLL
ncbi:MAG TPA: Nramp family divalent metal transporter [Gemmatimonadaceae bacterium]|nr:Nramp family divalent metal transporter [Gemmatimonadaceae bacterium]